MEGWKRLGTVVFLFWGPGQPTTCRSISWVAGRLILKL